MTAVPLSVVIPARDGHASVAATLDVLVPQVASVGGEVVVVDGRGEDRSVLGPVRWIPMRDQNLLRLRARGLGEARGHVVAIGEDHAIPSSGWCDAVLRAHAEHPDVPAVVGCLINATASTVAGRANFLAFAAPYAPPLPRLPTDRPPPVSAVSFKRAELEALGRGIASLETDLLPRLYREGRMVADDRIRMEHYQDHGLRWSVANLFHVMRAGYGYVDERNDSARRRETVRWLLTRAPRLYFGQARDASDGTPRSRLDLTATALIIAGGILGAVVGCFTGPGHAADHMT